MITIHFLCHAQTEYNKRQDRIGGCSNHIDLSEEGYEQAANRGGWFARSRLFFDKVFCSSAVRARLTLKAITDAYKITDSEILYTDELNEVDQGDWQGKTRAEILTPEMLDQIVAESPHFRPPNGETHKEAEVCMENFVQENILEKYSEGTFLLVGHGLSFKCFLQGVMGFDPKMTYKIGCSNTSISRLHYDLKRGWLIDYLNWSEKSV